MSWPSPPALRAACAWPARGDGPHAFTAGGSATAGRRFGTGIAGIRDVDEAELRARGALDWPIGDRAARRSENISDCDRAGECCPRQHVCSRSTTEARIVQCPSKKYAVDSVGTRRFWSAGAAGSPVAA
jgi:hypothetical protein